MNARPTSSVKAERSIRQAVLSGNIEPGSWLRELSLAAGLGVSRTPVRDACNRLASEGLLRWSPKRGFQATELNEDELDAVYPVLVALEDLAIQSIAMALPELVASLRSIDLHSAVRKGGIAEIYSTDLKWHRRIIESANNPVLLETHTRMSDKLSRYIYAYWRDRGEFARSMQEHERIVEALAERDQPLAAALLRSHRLKGLCRIRRSFRASRTVGAHLSA